MHEFLRQPAPSFDEPLEMLAACHQRILAQCQTLARLVRHLPLHGADDQAQQAAANVLRYFDVAGRNHHADEEQDLFPMLNGLSSSRESLGPIIARLLEEHRELDHCWQTLHPQLENIAAGQAILLDVGLVERFSEANRQHIQCEETEILPAARRLLHPDQLATLSAAMVARRQT